jgi:hypothetical protein
MIGGGLARLSGLGVENRDDVAQSISSVRFECCDVQACCCVSPEYVHIMDCKLG